MSTPEPAVTAAVDRPLRKDAERNRERILVAAREVFATSGLAATLDDVAHHAGLGVGTVYRRFPTKEALVRAALIGRMADIVELAREALTQPSAWEGLVGFLRRSTDLQARDRGLRDLVLSSGWQGSDLPTMREQITPLLDELVDRAKAEGSLRPDFTTADFAALHFMLGEVGGHSAGFRPDLHRRYRELLLDGMRAGPQTSNLGDPMSSQDLEEFTAHWSPRRR